LACVSIHSKGALGLVLVLLTAPAFADQPLPRERPRPRLTLVLGGGSARGIAHVGVLQWLDEHRIPVDMVIGTSMGGLIGGAFASGMSPGELRQLVTDIDWNRMFLGESPYAVKTMRRKEDARLYPSRVRFGFKNGLRAPNALEPGQQINMLLQHIALPYYDLATFDDLPTPFRCVAVDVRTSKKIVLADGPLWQALRATMSIPGVFAPVIRGEHVLIDGGVLDNVPTDVARTFGPEGVIAINVGSSGGAEREPATSYLAAIMQTMDVMSAATLVSSLEAADIAIRPQLDDIGSLAWRQADAIIQRGYDAAALHGQALLRWSVDEERYRAWLAARSAKRRHSPPQPDVIRVVGAPETDQAEIERQLKPLLGRPLDATELAQHLTAATGTDRYDTATADFVTDPTGLAMNVSLVPKAYGPPFLFTALDLENAGEAEFTVDIRARFVTYDVVGYGSELRVDGGIGTGTTAGVQLYRPIGRSRWFVAGGAVYDRSTQRLFNEGTAVAQYRVTERHVAAEVGLNVSRNMEIRSGYVFGWLDAGVRIGAPIAADIDGAERHFRTRTTYDSFDSPMVPSRGTRIRGDAAFYQDTAHVVDGDTSLAATPAQAELTAAYVRSVRTKDRLFAAWAGGTSFGDSVALPYTFQIGGLLRVGSLDPGEERGSSYMAASLGYLLGIGRLPDLLGSGVYLAGVLESGSAYERLGDAQIKNAFTGGIIAETFFGPLFLGASVGAGGNGRVYVSLKPLFQ
jgi:NTE family protein